MQLPDFERRAHSRSNRCGSERRRTLQHVQGKLDLDLSEAIRLSRQAEARLEGQNLLRSRVDLVQKSSSYVSDETGKVKPTPQPPRAISGKKCGYCGRAPQHKKEACSARSATCYSCGKKGYYSSVCRST